MTFTLYKAPDTLQYREMKRFIVGNDFPWFWTDFTVKNSELSDFNQDGFYSHVLLARPKWENISGTLFPTPASNHFQKIYPAIEEIFEYNQIPVNCLYRVNANLVHPGSDKMTPPHVDHQFPHKNLIVYLTDAGGPTILTERTDLVRDMHHPKEDDIVVFDGMHCMIPPPSGRRIVLVVTFS